MKRTVIVFGIGLLVQLAACTQEESESLSPVSSTTAIVLSDSDVTLVELDAGTYAFEATATDEVRTKIKVLQRIYQLTPSGGKMVVLVSDGLHSAYEVIQGKGENYEDFARAQFCEFPDSEKLSAPSFEQFRSGLNDDGLVEFQIALEEETVYKLVDESKRRDAEVEALAEIMLKRVIEFCY